MAKQKKQKAFDLEAVYDSEIAPLMSKIIDICKEHKLPMFATFLCANDPDGEDLICTTNLMFEERPIPEKLLALAPWVLADEPHQHDPEECYSGTYRICDIRKGERIPATYNIQALLAEYFGIDRKKLDAEKEELLAELRKR